METILKAIVGAFLNWGKLWYKEEKAKADEWNAKAHAAMLESVKSAEDMKVKIRSVEVPLVATPSAWNNNLKILPIFLLSLLLTGCIVRTVYVESKFPVIERPEWPQISEAPGFSDRERIIIDYAIELEAKVNAYNGLAHEHNKRNGYED